MWRVVAIGHSLTDRALLPPTFTYLDLAQAERYTKAAIDAQLPNAPLGKVGRGPQLERVRGASIADYRSRPKPHWQSIGHWQLTLIAPHQTSFSECITSKRY